MSNKAIGDDGKEHFADNLQDSYVGEYYCPNPACHVQMKRKNIGSDIKAYGSKKPYFSAGRNAPHLDTCPYKKACISYEDLKKAGFLAHDFFERLQRGFNAAIPRTRNAEEPMAHTAELNAITTLNKLYHYCLQHRDKDTLPDGTKIFEIFQDNRNKAIPNKDRHTAKLVRLRFLNCNFKEFDTEKYCYKLWCMFPHSEKTKPPGIYYTLGFREESLPLMQYFCKILTPLKQRHDDLYLLVGGEWKGNHCYVASKRQIFILSPDN